ncbi:MAG: GNAT family N-acetyltransferase [Vallitaleaceae bacterium]|nr:GNAT family N-acetyltransferase [Vallitaleaceae bacterium]
MMIVKKIDNLEQMNCAYAIRQLVFTEEQGVPTDIERDLYDSEAVHVIALADGLPVGTGRIVIHQNQGKIGRVAVLKTHRGLGLGQLICQKLLEIAKTLKLHQVMLHAQIDAKDFYIKMGFLPVGHEFIEADIKHIKMEKSFD